MKLEDYFRQHTTYEVFWKIEGSERKVRIPMPTSHVTFCAKANKVLIVGLQGVIGSDLHAKDFQWVLKAKDLLILSMVAESRGSGRMLLIANDGGSHRLFLLGLDVFTGRTTKFDISEIPSGMEFIDPNSAFASVGQDLIFIKFLTGGIAQFDVRPKEIPRGCVRGMYNGQILVYSECEAEKKEIIEFGEVVVPFDQRLKYIKPSFKYVWAVSEAGHVYRIGPDGSKTLMETINLEKVVGMGLCTRGLWLATGTGDVTVLGQVREEERINLP